MSDFTILIKNKSGQDRAYFLFAELPQVSASSQQIFSNVYMSAPPIPSGSGTAAFRLKKTYFAVTGTRPGQGLSSGVSVDTTDYEIAKLAQGDKLGSTVYMTAGPTGLGAEFEDDKLQQQTRQQGAFTIITDGSFTLGNGANQFIGLGGQDPLDPTNIIPIATFPAQPNTTTIISPRPKYYITWGSRSPGQIIDITTAAEPAIVDFTGKAASLCKVVHNEDGTWALTFD
ncbi:hypothetical protein EJ04DRAFT_352495 [Polyplosphaeria fusca]|uniref:Uncharacterized protein n=1 Tax=Polyplosphaeria fusca TaxID=682080 RepID=A0A9P4QVB1_9PLEO|nr:hypothetical protein EJ04DRAFT_352495 [Polyplosphaeria fusca]